MLVSDHGTFSSDEAESRIPHELDYRMFIPGHTVWSGDLFGLEVQVRAELRQPIGAVL
jgi:hypothetical protein